MTVDCVLRESTPEEYLKIISINFQSWGHPLSPKEYIDREHILAELSKDVRQHWVLMRSDEILASCETYKRPLVAKIEGQIVNGYSYGVASVFVFEELRGNGYAQIMMKMFYEKIFSGKDDLIGNINTLKN